MPFMLIVQLYSFEREAKNKLSFSFIQDSSDFKLNIAICLSDNDRLEPSSLCLLSVWGLSMTQVRQLSRTWRCQSLPPHSRVTVTLSA